METQMYAGVLTERDGMWIVLLQEQEKVSKEKEMLKKTRKEIELREK